MPGANRYAEVGDSSPDIRYFMLENVQADNQTQVRIRSFNGSFPETAATVLEVGDGMPGKIDRRGSLTHPPPRTLPA